MPDPFPDDNADALHPWVEEGTDLTKEVEVNFTVEVPNRDAAYALAAAVGPLGFKTTINQSDATGKWTCYCARLMVPSYDAIMAVQEILAELGHPVEDKPAGWSTLGNANP